MVERYIFYYNEEKTCQVDVNNKEAVIQRFGSRPLYEYPFFSFDTISRAQFDYFMEQRSLAPWLRKNTSVIADLGMNEYDDKEYLRRTGGRTPLDKITVQYLGEVE